MAVIVMHDTWENNMIVMQHQQSSVYEPVLKYTPTPHCYWKGFNASNKDTKSMQDVYQHIMQDVYQHIMIYLPWRDRQCSQRPLPIGIIYNLDHINCMLLTDLAWLKSSSSKWIHVKQVMVGLSKSLAMPLTSGNNPEEAYEVRIGLLLKHVKRQVWQSMGVREPAGIM